MRPPLATLLAVVLCSAGSSAAQSVTLGSPLTVAPNISIDCSVMPVLADPSGNYGLFPSGVADCTWRQSGVFGVPNDPRHSSVPGDGTIVAVTVRSGPNPAPLRVAVFRQLSSQGFEGGFGQCCFFTGESATLQPQPNAVTTFPVSLPVVRNTVEGFHAVDLIGVSAASGAGTLPLFSTGRNNSFQLTEPGSVNAGFFYPRLGAVPNDAGGGRREEGIPGVEVLMNFTWCPAGAAAGPGVCAVGPGPGPGGGGPALRAQNAAVAAGRALIDLACNGNAVCRGVLELLNATGVAVVTNARKKGPGRFGKQRYEIAGGSSAIVGVRLNRKAKRLLRRVGGLATIARITPDGGAPITGNVLLTP